MLRRTFRYLTSKTRGTLFAAQVQFVQLTKTDTPGGSGLEQLYSTTNLSDFLNGLFKFAITIGAIFAVLRIAYAGYLYMGQSDMWSSKGKAKEILSDVTLGLLLLLSIYLILNQINPQILQLDALKNITPATNIVAPEDASGRR